MSEYRWNASTNRREEIPAAEVSAMEAKRVEAAAAAKAAEDARKIRRGKAKSAYDELVKRLGQEIVDILPALMRANGNPDKVE